jgi:hypothetical protein
MQSHAGICAQVLSPEYGNREWDSEEEDGFDPYWGVVDEGSMREGDLRADAAFLVSQLAPLLGHHAPKCGLLRGLADAAGIAIESVTRPGMERDAMHAAGAMHVAYIIIISMTDTIV